MSRHPLEGISSLGIRLSYRDVFGNGFTRQKLVETLADYRLETVLDFLGRISAVMYNGTVSSPETQWQLCSTLFGEESSRIWKVVERAAVAPTGSAHSRAIVLFDEMSVALAAKIALFVDRTDCKGDRTDTAGIGEVLLMVNQFLDEEAPNFQNSSIEDWIYFTFVNAASQPVERGLHPLARAFELFLCDKPQLKQSAHYIDLPHRIQTATGGLNADQFMSVLFGFLTHFQLINGTNAHERYAWLHQSEYFAAFSFTPEQVSSFLSLIARSSEEMMLEVDREMSITAVRALNNSSLNRSPCIVIGDRVYCPVLRFMVERITIGIYHQMLNAPPEQGMTADQSKDRFFRYIGDVFEDYVDRLVRRVLLVRNGASNGFIYLGPSELRRILPDASKACDHLLFDGSTLMLWETKARFVPLKARVGEDKSHFIARFGELIKRAAAQLSATIELVESGALINSGVHPHNIRRILPAVVSLADYPMSPPIFEFVQQTASEFVAFAAPNTRPLELIMVKELENLEGLWSQGLSLGDFLAEKIEHEWWRKNSIHNYFVANKGRFPVTRNAYLDSVFESVMNKIELFYQSHSADRLWNESKG